MSSPFPSAGTRPVDAVLFDLDGTLTDPFEGITGSYRHAMAHIGRPVPDDVDLGWVIGPPILDNIERLGVPAAQAQAVVAAYRARHVAVGLYQAVVVPGVEELLADLHRAGVRVALATAKPESEGVTTVVHFGLDRYFTVTGGTRPGGPTTKGEVVRDVLGRLHDLDRPREDGHGASGDRGLARTMMVGDRRHDVEGAHENGIQAIGVGWGFAADGELADAGADHLAATVAELRLLLLG